MTGGAEEHLSSAALAILEELALRGETALRLDPELEVSLLRSIVDTTAALFQSEAASIALHDEQTDELRFVVAAGAQGQSVVGRSFPAHQGIAGYVFSTGESIALAEPARDPRFGRAFAEGTGYVPRSILAVPLEEASRTIGVLEVLDKRAGPFSIEDIAMASLFARQAATAIQAVRRVRDMRSVLQEVLGAGPREMNDVVEEVVSAATRKLAGDDRFWEFVDAVAAMRHASAADRAFAIELLDLMKRYRTPARPASGQRLRHLPR